jgi:hypothetical protein
MRHAIRVHTIDQLASITLRGVDEMAVMTEIGAGQRGGAGRTYVPKLETWGGLPQRTRLETEKL